MLSEYKASIILKIILITINVKLLIKHFIMVKFPISTKNGIVNFNFPTTLAELTESYLSDISDDIEIADNYTLIALCHREKLSTFVLAGTQKRNEVTTSVVPIFVKRGNISTSINTSIENNFIANIKYGSKLIISPTAMSLGIHFSTPKNTLTMPNFVKLIEKDPFASQKASIQQDKVYFVEFKLIPNSDIIGCVVEDNNKKFNNPFGVVKEDSTDTAEAI